MKRYDTEGFVSFDGALEFSQPRATSLAFKTLFPGEPVSVSVTKRTKKRSVQANAFYWVMVTAIAEHTGYSKKQVHAMLKSMFLSEVVWLKDASGENYKQVTLIAESKSLSRKEFAEFIENVIRLCDDLDIVLPAYEGDKYSGNLGD